MKTKRAAARFFREREQAGLNRMHVRVQTYVWKKYSLERTRMRTYECVLLPEEADEFHHSQHNEKK